MEKGEWSMEKRIQVRLDEDFDPSGIARIVQIASQYASTIYLELDGNQRVNAKSIMGMMNFMSKGGSELVINAKGPDEAEAIDAIAACLGGKG